jgi:hypothetical protein
MSRHFSGPGLLPAAMPWIKVFGGLFAVVGFVFKDKVGSAVGGMIAAILNAEVGNHPKEHHLSWPQILLVLVVLALVAWYFLK